MRLVGSKSLTQAAFRAGAGDGIADRGAGSDKAGPGGPGRDGNFRGKQGGRGARRGQSGGQVAATRGVMKGEGPGIVASAGAAHMVEIRLAAQVLLGTKAHGLTRDG